MTKQKEWIEFETTVTLKGEYKISDEMVTVRCEHSEKDPTQLGGLPASHLAEMLLREIARNPFSADVSRRRRPRSPDAEPDEPVPAEPVL